MSNATLSLPMPLLRDGRVYAVLAAAGFSLKAVFVKLAYAAGPVDALSLLAMRMLLALPLFAWLVFSAPASGQPLQRKQLAHIALLACIGYYLSSLYDFIGLSYISAGLERMILYVYPTLVLLIGMYFSRGSADLAGERDEAQGARRAEGETYHADSRAFEHRASATELGKQSLPSELPAFGTRRFARTANKSVHPKQKPGGKLWQALAICYSGLLLAFGNDLQQKSDFSSVLIGGGWIFAAAFVYALYFLGVADLIGKVGSLRLTGLAGMFSCGWVLLHFALFGQISQLQSANAGVWGNALLMALLSTVLPIYWLALAIQRLGPGPAAAAGSIGPVLTLFAAWLLLGESISLLQLAGMALVMLGVARIKR